MSLNDTFTSTGAKFFAHQEAMEKLRNGWGQPIVTHVMLTDVCNHTCAFCSVQARARDTLPLADVTTYLDILRRHGLKAVILSGGGNPILYRDKTTGADFNDVVDEIYGRGLEIGLITNGMPLTRFDVKACGSGWRRSWKTVHPTTLDKITWVRISMSGLDHYEGQVYVPDVDPARTALGFSYVAHDIYHEPADPHHGKVSRRLDLLSGNHYREPDWSFDERIPALTNEITQYCLRHDPRYVRLLPNCLEPERIKSRCEQLGSMARSINEAVGREVVFVQNKPPAAPRACYLGYIHPVLNCDGYVYPCDSCVLNEAAGHSFANPWRICRWQDIGGIYERPVRSLIEDPGKTCPGCVFTRSNDLLEMVVNGSDLPSAASMAVPQGDLEHINFV